jgi:hypothetical protein
LNYLSRDFKVKIEAGLDSETDRLNYQNSASDAGSDSK